MQSIHHFNVTTEGRTYQFDLVARDRDPASGYRVIPADERDRTTIGLFLKNVTSSSTPNELARELKRLPGVTRVQGPHQFAAKGPQDMWIPTTDPFIQHAQQRAREKETAAKFLSSLPRNDEAIDLKQLTRLPGGGTHDIYKFHDDPFLLLKVMRDTAGNTPTELKDKLCELTQKYEELYEVFGTSRCLVETRFIKPVKADNCPEKKDCLVSVVRFDSCFKSEVQFGFNTDSLETDGLTIAANLPRYHAMNLALMGSNPTKELDPEPFLSFQESFRPIFKRLDEDGDLRVVMEEFLTKFKIFYKRTDQLMDFQGLDNVLFYKEGAVWKYKVGSVIKQETGAAARAMLQEIATNPSAVNESGKKWVQIFYVPPWTRALNATAAKLGMGRIVEDITLTAEDSKNLAEIHKTLPLEQQAVTSTRHGNFEQAIRLLREYEATSSNHSTWARFEIGVGYWQKGPANKSAQVMASCLKLLIDPQNDFPPEVQGDVLSTLQGLRAELEPLEPETQCRLAKILERISQ